MPVSELAAARRAYRRGGAAELLATTRRWAALRLDPGPAAPPPPPRRPKPRTGDLERYFDANTGRQIHKWRHYFDIYEHHFARFRGKPVTVVEFGVAYGGSLEMWRDYFGPRARIIGVDIDEACRRYAGDGIEIVIGDQADRGFLRELADAVGPIDVVIEDGGHRMYQQIHTLEEIYPRMKPRGVYLCEDVHTSYIATYGGGFRRAGTFVEHVKARYDELHAWHSRSEQLTVTDFTRSTRSIHLYPGVVVFERGRVDKPQDAMTGVKDRVPGQPRGLRRPSVE